MLIWYNPDTDDYQKGGYKEFLQCNHTSRNKDRFELLYEFNPGEDFLATKILDSLNHVRKSPVDKIRFSKYS